MTPLWTGNDAWDWTLLGLAIFWSVVIWWCTREATRKLGRWIHARRAR